MPPTATRAGRFVRSIKEECLNRIVPLGEWHLRRALTEFVRHYHFEWPHIGFANELIDGVPVMGDGAIQRRERLGEMLLSYYREAA